jgi:hypothetical protein
LNYPKTPTTTTTITNIISCSPADPAAGLGLNPEFLKFLPSISSSAILSAVDVSSNVQLDNFEDLKFSDGYELGSHIMSVIIHAICINKIVVSSIDPSQLASSDVLVTFLLAPRQGLLAIIQVLCNEIFNKFDKFKSRHDIQIYLQISYRPNSGLLYICVLLAFICIKYRICSAKVSRSEYISTFEMDWNYIAHLLQSLAASSSMYRKTPKDLFSCQAVQRDFLLARFAKSHFNIVENLLSTDRITYYQRK